MEQQTAKFQSLTQANFLLKKSKKHDARLIILNHGFMSNNEKMWSRLIDQLPEDCHVLAANGPFPIPVKQDNHWKVGYSWFFYNNFKQSYFIGYDVCQDFMKNLCQHLGFHSHKKTIIGYSQGGYAAPHMAETLENVDHVIGIGCRFKINDPQWSSDLLIEAVHGEDDDVVEWSGAQESFAKLPPHHQGRIQGFAGVGHKPSQEMLETVGDWLRVRGS